MFTVAGSLKQVDVAALSAVKSLHLHEMKSSFDSFQHIRMCLFLLYFNLKIISKLSSQWH